MAREARKAGRYSAESDGGELIYRPEDRVRENAWLGVGVYASLLIWYGWVVQEGVVWWVPVSLTFPRHTSHTTAVNALLTISKITSDDRRFPLRRPQHASLRPRHHNGHGTPPAKTCLWRRAQLHGSQPLCLRWVCDCAAADRRHGERVVVYGCRDGDFGDGVGGGGGTEVVWSGSEGGDEWEAWMSVVVWRLGDADD